MNGISQLLDSLRCIMLAVDALTSQKEPWVQRTNTSLTRCQTGHEYSSPDSLVSARCARHGPALVCKEKRRLMANLLRLMVSGCMCQPREAEMFHLGGLLDLILQGSGGVPTDPACR